MALPEHIKTGLRGEQLTARYLRKQGYTVLETNFTTTLGETDIVATDNKGTLCFIEVKTRSPGAMLPPSEAVDDKKQQNLINNAAAYIKSRKPEYTEIRFDIAEVILKNLYTADISLIKDAFGSGVFSII